jgi:hypothetical protein
MLSTSPNEPFFALASRLILDPGIDFGQCLIGIAAVQLFDSGREPRPTGSVSFGGLIMRWCNSADLSLAGRRHFP